MQLAFCVPRIGSKIVTPIVVNHIHVCEDHVKRGCFSSRPLSLPYFLLCKAISRHIHKLAVKFSWKIVARFQFMFYGRSLSECL